MGCPDLLCGRFDKRLMVVSACNAAILTFGFISAFLTNHKDDPEIHSNPCAAATLEVEFAFFAKLLRSRVWIHENCSHNLFDSRTQTAVTVIAFAETICVSALIGHFPKTCS